MKLSEAIRLGSMNRPQTRRRFEHQGATCALGAALDAIGKLGVNDHFAEVCANFPVVLSVASTCPVTELRDATVEDAILMLNDDHRWTREQIADWVQTIEDAQQPPDPTCDSSDLKTEKVEATAAAHVRSQVLVDR